MSHVRVLTALAAMFLFAPAGPATADVPARPHGTESAQMVQAKPEPGATSPTLSDAEKRALLARIEAAQRKSGGCAKSKPTSGGTDFSFQGFGDSGSCANSRR